MSGPAVLVNGAMAVASKLVICLSSKLLGGYLPTTTMPQHCAFVHDTSSMS